MTYSKEKEYGWLEAKQSSSVVNQDSLAKSKVDKEIRRIAQPLMNKHWKDSVQNLHRIYRVAEYLYKRKKRSK